MKKYILIALLVPAFLFAGLHTTAFAQTGTASARGNAAPGEALPGDLQGVDVKDYYIDSAARPAGSIRTLIGHVVVLHEDTGQAYFAAGGDAIFKNDTVFTLNNSRCRLRFTTGDIITMGDNGRIGIAEYIDDRVHKEKKSIFSMLRGKAMFYALRLFKYRTATSSVKTPTAIIGVRGTKFGVEVEIVGDKIAQNRPIYLADASGSNFQHLLAQAGPAGPPVIVRAYCFNGSLNVSRPGLAPGAAPPGASAPPPTVVVSAGQDVKATPAQISPPSPTSSTDANAFIGATNAPDPQAPQGQGDTGEQQPAPAPAPATGDSGASDPTDTSTTDQADDVASIQADKTIEDQSTASTKKGYFTGMLTDLDSTPYLDDVYVSSSRQDFNSGTVRANGLFHTEGFVDGSTDDGFDNPKLKQARVHSTAATADNLGLVVTTHDIGSNTYMEWGYWYVADIFTVVSGGVDIDHDLKNKGYYVFGYPTPDAVAAGISGDYSGVAYGTYWSGSGSAPRGIDMIGMSGDFSCHVEGSAAMNQITNFDWYVTGGGKTAFISGASGTLNGSAFDINTATGLWKLGPTGSTASANYKSAHGSLYGPNGEHIGGGVGLKIDSYNGVQGNFAGDKSPPM